MAKDIVADGRAGNQSPHGSTASAGTEELLTDDGSRDTLISGDGLICVNRLTPAIYPATLRTIRIFFFPDLPSPVGKQIKLIVFAGAQGTTQPPSNPTLLVNQTVTIPIMDILGGELIDFQIQNGPTISSGDFYVGFQAPSPAGSVSFAGDTTGQPRQRSFASINNGQTFQGPLTSNGLLVNLMIRAIVVNNAVAAPRIEALPALSFGYAALGFTSEQALRVRNTGDAPLNITSMTANDPQFTLAPLTLPLTIPAGGGQGTIRFRFAPTSPGAQNAALTIISNDPARPSLNITLGGVGGQPPTAWTVFTNSGASQTDSIIAPTPGGAVIYWLEYAIFVPAGASELKIDLSGNQNLNLRTRFNQPVYPKSGGAIAHDHISDNPGVAPESISITPSTSPPLRSGLYYIAITNFGPGAANYTLTATVTGGTAPGVATTVSAASFVGPDLSSEAIVAGFGSGLATSSQAASSQPLPTTLAGTTIKVRDDSGTERLAPLFFVSPEQANFQIPPDTANGAAFLTFTSDDGKTSTGVARIVVAAPGIFTANANGQGVPAAVVFRVRADGSQTFEPASRFDFDENRFVPLPIDLGPESDRVFLLLFGTGIRGFSGFVTVTATIGGIPVQVGFAGPAPGFIGLDQLNLGPLPR
ncbi:MAG: choice-of-anchor D domain-containing protein, partial [Blastocatellia bacterium]